MINITHNFQISSSCLMNVCSNTLKVMHGTIIICVLLVMTKSYYTIQVVLCLHTSVNACKSYDRHSSVIETDLVANLSFGYIIACYTFWIILRYHQYYVFFVHFITQLALYSTHILIRFQILWKVDNWGKTIGFFMLFDSCIIIIWHMVWFLLSVYLHLSG